MDANLFNLIADLFNLIAVLVLVGVTAWYARSTARMLKEMRMHARILSLSAAVGVEAGITALPPPGEVSAAQSDAFGRLKFYRDSKITPLLKELGIL